MNFVAFGTSAILLDTHGERDEFKFYMNAKQQK